MFFFFFNQGFKNQLNSDAEIFAVPNNLNQRRPVGDVLLLLVITFTKPTLKSNNITHASLCFGLVLQFYILIEQDTLSRSDVQHEKEFRAKSKAFVCKTV